METVKASEFLSTRIQPDLSAAIEKLAEEERRSLSQMTAILLEEAVEARKNKGKKSRG